jgi:lipopolysaccharide assembly outer membrane protein LptD (OstA)
MGRLKASASAAPIRALLFTIFIFIIIFPFYAVLAEDNSGPLVLEHADQLISVGGSGEIVNLIGNVHFIHDKADLYSQRATWYKASGLVQFIDSVKVEDDNRQITAQSMTYYRRERKITAIRGVEMIDKKQDIILYCQRADYSRDTKYLEAIGNPQLTFNPEDDTARLEINARRMSYYADSAFGAAYDSVVITRRDLIAKAGQANFYKNPERVILTINPIIIRGENQLSGDTISMFTENKKLQRLFVQGDARALYRVLPDTAIKEYTTAEMKGRVLEAFFANDQIETMVTRYNATSVYSPAVSDTLVRGINTASGDSITLFFAKNAIKRVFISGGAQGEYVEPKFEKDGKVTSDTTRYSGKDINYNFDDGEITLFDNGTLRYHDMSLNAGDVRYKTASRILVAQGLGSDTAGEEIQSPVLKQGTEELHGKKMSYNIDTRKGQVRMARTQFDDGYYYGKTLRQPSKEVLLVSSGDFTSCDLPDDPHYHFSSPRMKMLNKDKIVARPVYLYIGQLPVFAIPFYVYPIKKGRHSGFLPFNIGNFQRGERYIRNVGYFWAASDYWDLQTSLDFYESSKTVFNNIFRYQVHDAISGNMRFNFTRSSSWINYSQVSSSQWQFLFSHAQKISQSITLSGSGQFVSSKSYIPQNSYNLAERLNRTLSSNLTFSQSLKSLSSSLSITLRQDWNLDTDSKSEVLPSFSFSRSSLPLFPDPTKAKKKTRLRPWEEVKEPHKRFYNAITFSGSISGQNQRQRSRLNDSTFTYKNYQLINTQTSFYMPQKFLSFLTITPSLSLTHSAARLERNITTDTLGLAPDKFVTRAYYSLGIGTNTAIFGTVNPHWGPLIGIRHVVTPSVGYSFTPQVRKNQTYFSYIGVGSGSTRAKAVSYTLGNLFQAKFKTGDTDKKIDLFTLNFTSGYNFAATQSKIVNLVTSLRTSSIPNVDFSFSSTHSFYKFDNITRRPILQPRLTDMRFSTSTRFGFHPGTKAEKSKEGKDKITKPLLLGAKKNGVGDASALGLDMTLSHDYAVVKDVNGSHKSQWLNVSTQITPTRNWRISYDCRYNTINKRIESQEFNIGRDLHCWEASFTWIPSGTIAGYYFIIRIKSIPSIKVESSEGGLGAGRYFQ